MYFNKKGCRLGYITPLVPLKTSVIVFILHLFITQAISLYGSAAKLTTGF